MNSSLKTTFTQTVLAVLAGLLFTSFFSGELMAQTPAAGALGTNPDTGRKQPAGQYAAPPAQGERVAEGGPSPKAGAFSVKGKVMDGTTSTPVQFATVTILRLADSSLVTGALADEQGNFTVEGVPGGSYLMRVGFIGYGDIFRPIQLSSDAPTASIGTITLSQKSRRLQEVVIEAERPVMQLGIDRKTFDVSKSNLNPGGSASDVLGNIPTVSVDQDGNVSLRNNENVTIYIDGRPSGITGSNRAAILRQIPAASIDRIELITSPSARYDAEGVSGIINIILKKNKLEGLNGSVQASIGNRNKQGASANIAYRNRWMNTYFNYSFRNQNRYNHGYLNRFTWLDNTSNSLDSLNSLSTPNSNRAEVNHAFKVGADFYLPRNSTLGFSAGVSPNTEREIENTQYLLIRSSVDSATNLRNRTTSQAFRKVDNLNKGMNQDYTLSYRKKFNDKGHELAVDGSYSDYDQKLLANYTQSGSLFALPGASFVNAPIQQNRNNNRTKTLIGQLDYVRPMANGYKLEAGLKNTNRHITNDFHYLTAQAPGETLTEVNIQRNLFAFHENTLAGYGILSRQWSRFGTQLGLRVERTNIDATSKDTLTEKPVTQPAYFFFSPSVNVSYKLNSANDLQFGFSRRINRPGREQLNPFVDYSDPTSRRTGNPAIRPEQIDALEATWQYSPGQSSFTTTAFYRYTEHQSVRYISVDTGVSTVTFINVGHREDYGLETVARVVPFKGFSITGSGSLFGSNIVAPDSIIPGSSKKNVNYNFRLLFNYQMKAGTNFQLTSGYRSPFRLPQGNSRPFYNTDVAVSQEFYKKKLQASVAVNDIFNTLRFGIVTAGNGFDAQMSRKRETRFVTFSLTYRFGSPDNLSRRRERNNNQGGGSGGQGDMQF